MMSFRFRTLSEYAPNDLLIDNKLVRTIPINSRPMNFFKSHTPTSQGVPDPIRRGEWNFKGPVAISTCTWAATRDSYWFFQLGLAPQATACQSAGVIAFRIEVNDTSATHPQRAAHPFG